MLPFEDRYTRQRQLREVGFAGQVRIEQIVATLPESPVGRIAADYLRRAGARGVATDPAAPDAVFPFAELFSFPSSHAVAAGSYHALQLMRSALGAPGTASEPDARAEVEG